MRKNKEKCRSIGTTTKYIAMIVTVTIMLGTLAILAASFWDYIVVDGKKICVFKGVSKEVMQILLPLWGTWIGTILAFYFGKTNFETAAKSYDAVIEKLTPNEKIATMYVKDYMIPLWEIAYLQYETEKDITIEKILEYPQFAQYNRYPVFEKDNVVKCIVHRSLFYKFIQLKVKAELETSQIKTLTLNDLLNTDDNSIKETLAKSFEIVSIEQTLLNAKEKINNNPECADVFVTKTGKKDESVCGLVTDNMILKEAEV